MITYIIFSYFFTFGLFLFEIRLGHNKEFLEEVVIPLWKSYTPIMVFINICFLIVAVPILFFPILIYDIYIYFIKPKL